MGSVFIKTMRFIKKLSFIFLASLPVIAFTFKFSILDRHNTFPDDWGYFAQVYEAARLSILKYHEFPWINSWSIGGIPLYANPQFGLFSIPMALVLLFGTVVGLHLSVLVYFLIGFWGMYFLLLRLGVPTKYNAILLSYIWVFSGFIVSHMAVGHLTFSAYLLSPWFFLTLLNIHKKRGWLWFALATILLILQAPHYITIEVLTIGLVVAAVQIGRLLYNDRCSFLNLVKPYVFSLLIIVPFITVKLLFVFQYLHEYPRITPLDMSVSPALLVTALAFRDFQSHFNSFHAQYNWWEYADYMGIISLGLFVYVIISQLFRKGKLNFIGWAMIITIGIAFLLAMGPFSAVSPYSIIHRLPIFNEMRIPSRWIGWISFGIILFLARLPKKTIIYCLLSLSVIDVFLANFSILNSYEQLYKTPASYQKTIEQYSYYEFHQMSLSALYATQSNIGQIYGYEPILGFGGYYDVSYYSTQTNRCGLNQGCDFVESHNAKVTYWSPLKIDLTRTGKGAVVLDMNPGKDWLINGARVFSKYRILELKKNFIINNPAKAIEVTYSPSI